MLYDDPVYLTYADAASFHDRMLIDMASDYWGAIDDDSSYATGVEPEPEEPENDDTSLDGDTAEDLYPTYLL